AVPQQGLLPLRPAVAAAHAPGGHAAAAGGAGDVKPFPLPAGEGAAAEGEVVGRRGLGGPEATEQQGQRGGVHGRPPAGGANRPGGRTGGGRGTRPGGGRTGGAGGTGQYGVQNGGRPTAAAVGFPARFRRGGRRR